MQPIKISAALAHLVSGSAARLGQMPWDTSVLDTVGFFQLTEEMSNREVLNQPQIGGLDGICQSALSLDQAAHILAFQHELQENLVSARNRGFVLIDSQLYEVQMSVWRYHSKDTELVFDATDLDEATWHMGSRVFYNTKPRDQQSTSVELSMSIAREIYEGIRSDEAVGGVFPRLIAA